MQAAKMVYTCHACEAEARQKRFQKRIVAAGIPADVWHATLDNFDTQRAGVKTGEGMVGPEKFHEKASRFAAGEIRNLILAGVPGVGKGHLAAAVVIPRIANGESVVWAECSALFREYHAAYKHDTTEAVIVKHAACTTLVLDEVCLIDMPKDGEEILFSILDRRHKAARQTLMLGNAIAETVRKWLGSRITDRLRSGGVAFCYGEWESMRGSQADGATNEF